ncbi:MAG: hypothetical protein ABMA00_10435 [Gemmatimonas sp.]
MICRIARGRRLVMPLVAVLCGACGGAAEVRPEDSLLAAGPPIALERSDLDYLTDPAVLVVGRSALYVADASQGEIVEYSRAGQRRRHIGSRGNGPGQYIGPTAMTLMHDTLLLVADAALHRVSVFVTTQGSHFGAYFTPAQVYSIAERGDTVVFGMQDLERKTSVGRLLPGDSVVWQIGPIADDILRHPRVAQMYPLSLVTPTTGGYRIGFTGSALTYRVDAKGQVVDSTIPPTRWRRGVPTDLDARLDTARTISHEAAPASLLVMMGARPDHGVVMVHLDFVMDGGAVGVRAFLSTLDADGRSRCVDQIVPIATEARPVFALVGDTLFVVQNRSTTGSGAVRTVLTRFVVHCRSG